MENTMILIFGKAGLATIFWLTFLRAAELGIIPALPMVNFIMYLS